MYDSKPRTFADVVEVRPKDAIPKIVSKLLGFLPPGLGKRQILVGRTQPGIDPDVVILGDDVVVLVKTRREVPCLDVRNPEKTRVKNYKN